MDCVLQAMRERFFAAQNERAQTGRIYEGHGCRVDIDLGEAFESGCATYRLHDALLDCHVRFALEYDGGQPARRLHHNYV